MVIMAGRIHSFLLVIVAIILGNFSTGSSACDTYYSIASDLLSRVHWESVTVNGNQVFVNTLSNKTFTTNFHLLDEDQRDLIQEIKQKSLINLNGLGLTLPPQPSTNLNYGNSVSSYASNSYGQNTFAGPVSLASQALDSSTSGSNYYGSGGATGSSRFTGSPSTLTATSASTSTGSAYGSSSPSASGVVGSGSSGGGGYGAASTAASQQNYVASPTAYNYYNLGQCKLLKESLSGDVYSFSLLGYIVDVFSSTALVNQRSGQSILYRDHRYFSYAQQYMALGINRFFLTKNTVIFVYNDATVLAKASWMLNAIELDLVIGARTKIKELTGRIAMAEELSYKSPSKSHKSHKSHHGKHHQHHDDNDKHHHGHHDKQHHGHHEKDHHHEKHHDDEHHQHHHDYKHEKHDDENDHEKHHHDDKHHHSHSHEEDHDSHEKETVNVSAANETVKVLL